MKIMVECECGNKAEMTAPKMKYIQLRDNLENSQFLCEGDKNTALREVRIRCKNCGNWISLGLD